MWLPKKKRKKELENEHLKMMIELWFFVLKFLLINFFLKCFPIVFLLLHNGKIRLVLSL